MSDASTSALRAALVTELRVAYLAARGVPPTLERRVRDHARALRLDGVMVEKMIIDVKEIIRAETGHHELVFIPPLIGWAVAGFFAGTATGESEAGGRG